jgi:DNA topoisomerase-1
MSKSLVIVESPAKAKTIKKYLGKGFEVMASLGHIRDLEAKNGAVDPENKFALRYAVSDDKHEEQFNKIAKALEKADTLYLATDPDREGEAIAWHLCEMLKERGYLEGKEYSRVVFHEITKRAIKEAIEHPRDISMDLVEAQLARRALDHLIGFKLSPVLWDKIRIRNLSAGRVQSPALRLIVERENEIKGFKPKEYWTIEADLLAADEQPFKAKLTHYNEKKLTQFTVNNEKFAKEIEQAIYDSANGQLHITKIEKKKRKRNPSAPFITSTLQQEASRKLGYSAKSTMVTAQQLYEGIELDGETVGLITYMRTDSVNLAQEALTEIREVIVDKYGEKNLAKDIRTFKNKTKNAQEAHEAIRPTSAARDPASVKKYLSKQQFRLYELIWKRTVACQMIHATIDTVAIDLQAGEAQHFFRANGSTIADPGFMKVYQESVEDSDKKGKEDDNKGLLPPMEEGDKIPLVKIRPTQHFTEPPPRYSEASLVKALEEYGIGRPSTYAAIMDTLRNRQYAKLEKKRFYPSVIGRMVNKFLSEHFNRYVDYDFTAHMEDELNDISKGDREWIPVMQEFWVPLKDLIDDKSEQLKPQDVTLDEKCPKCKKPLTIKSGEFGLFIGCTGYPDCDYTRSINQDEDQSGETKILEDQKCPECESNLVIRNGPYGQFIGCTGYPDCRYLKPLQEPEDTKVECPECKKGTMLKRKSKRGRIFYSCSRFPDCKYAVWNKPVAETCPECQWPMMTIKTTKRSGSQKICEKCKYSEPYEPEEEEEKQGDGENQATDQASNQ